ncbi:MAG: 50S ribosomal protein L2 [Bacteroidales bacterium]|nr:50S ribosomal protein L2 [Bacteroidales bacterium]
MSVKKFKPITPGQRHKVISTFEEITESIPEKSLLVPITRSGGRNHSGKMTMRYMGGGHKKRYRIIDFKRDKDGMPAVVKTIEYDPNRSARISLVVYKDGEKRYIIAPHGIKVGQEIISGKGISPEIGNTLSLSDIPLGTVIHNIEINPGRGGQIARSAGAYATIVSREGKYANIKMASGEIRKILITCRATVGSVSNPDHRLESHGKAGRKRWLGVRPRTRGVVMNPVDHPMGGGEGKSSGGHPRSRKGIPAKGYKTRSPKKYSDKYIVERRKTKR